MSRLCECGHDGPLYLHPDHCERLALESRIALILHTPYRPGALAYGLCPACLTESADEYRGDGLCTECGDDEDRDRASAWQIADTAGGDR